MEKLPPVPEPQEITLENKDKLIAAAEAAAPQGYISGTDTPLVWDVLTDGFLFRPRVEPWPKWLFEQLYKLPSKTAVKQSD